MRNGSQWMCCFWRICWYVYETKISDNEGTVLAATLDELITKDTSRLMRPLSQEMNISRTTVGKMVSEGGSDIWKSGFHLLAWAATLPTTAKGRRFGSRRTSREVWEKEIRAPSSPDCNPFWLFCRGRLWTKSQSKSSNKTRDLVPYIREVMGFLARNTMEKSCERFRSLIDAVIAVDGNFIE